MQTDYHLFELISATDEHCFSRQCNRQKPLNIRAKLYADNAQLIKPVLYDSVTPV